MPRKLKISAVANNFILILALFILRSSEVFRGQNPLYVILKTISWTLLCSTIIISFVTIILILQNRSLLKNNILWITLSFLPLVYISIIVF